MRILPHAARILLRLIGYGTLGSLITGITIFVVIVERGSDLSVWHYADLDEEFTQDSEIADFSGYLALEDRLFRRLDELVYAKLPRQNRTGINRYSRGSLSDPERWPVNWNRSFVQGNEDPIAGVLLLHGLSDSPYSVRSLGEQLQQAGAWTLGLRIPGHGTAPSGLVEVRWQDMAAAVRLAARHVQQNVGDKPFYLVGYSNGGALALEYALAALEDSSLPSPQGIVLLSPEIAVSDIAAYAVWQARLGHLLGFEKLAWNSVLPEYDPYKYGSFPVNAGDLAHRITLHIQNRLTELQGSGKLERMPPILAFQSSVDATVTPEALLVNLFDRLPATPRELVLFDINRAAGIDEMLRRDPMKVFRPLLVSGKSGFDLTVVTNEEDESSRVVALRNEYGREDGATSTYVADWPTGIYSLSHVALPFPPDDPVYGGPLAAESPGIHLGNLDLRGERGVLHVSGSNLLRLRWNPFFDYVTARTLEFMQLDTR
jgi:alpha-beta hydrolase superfamily lysophospholipase